MSLLIMGKRILLLALTILNFFHLLSHIAKKLARKLLYDLRLCSRDQRSSSIDLKPSDQDFMQPYSSNRLIKGCANLIST